MLLSFFTVLLGVYLHILLDAGIHYRLSTLIYIVKESSNSLYLVAATAPFKKPSLSSLPLNFVRFSSTRVAALKEETLSSINQNTLDPSLQNRLAALIQEQADGTLVVESPNGNGEKRVLVLPALACHCHPSFLLRKDWLRSLTKYGSPSFLPGRIHTSLEGRRRRRSREFIDWFRGFTDAEGCFTIMKVGVWHGFRFSILLHSDDVEVLNYIQSQLGLGLVKAKNTRAEVCFEVGNRQDLFIIIAFFFSISEFKSTGVPKFLFNNKR